MLRGGEMCATQKPQNKSQTHKTNRLAIFSNLFGEAATTMLFYKIDRDYWDVVKTFIIFLGRLPDHPRTHIHDIMIDDNCLRELQKITDGKG